MEKIWILVWIMEIRESGENYLETIYILKEKIGQVRSIDIAAELNYSKPSISRAVNILRENNYVTMDSNGLISLTEKGEKIALKIYERHKFLTKLLMYLGIEEKKATTDACKIEHVISAESFNKIKEYFKEIIE